MVLAPLLARSPDSSAMAWDSIGLIGCGERGAGGACSEESTGAFAYNP